VNKNKSYGIEFTNFIDIEKTEDPEEIRQEIINQKD
jgi:hypothetical protein